jgi:signal peptidase I
VLRLVATASAALAVVVAAGYGETKPRRASSSAPEPTIRCGLRKLGCESRGGDRIVVRRSRHPKGGDVVVFKAPRLAATRCGASGIVVKRIVGLPGETWSERDGFVYVDRRKLREPYIRPDLRDHLTRPPITVPRDAYFVLGDNRSASCDSRVWGPLPHANLVGIVMRVKRAG